MVSQKRNGRKQRRHSYAERVLNAVSDIRTRSRKDSIHLNSLTTQVRKNADAQEDQLGPHWKAWVKVACENLASKHLFDSPPTHGHVTLTREGKMKLSEVRKSYGLTDGHRHSPACKETSAWKSVIRQLPDSGLRRSSRKSSASADEDASHKPLSRMTKAELLSEMKKLQKAFDDLSIVHRHSMDEKDREISNLNELLEKQEDAWLEESDTFMDNEADDSEIGDETLVHHDADGLDADKPESLSAVKRLEVGKTNTLRPPIVHTLSRTISGSFISNISKHATPAPSDIDSENGSQIYLDFTNDDDGAFDMDSTFIDDLGVEQPMQEIQQPRALMLARPQVVQMRTPSSTPAPPASYSDLDQRKKIERLVEERDEARHELQSKITALEASNAKCSSLENDIAAVRERGDRLQVQLAMQTDDLTITRATLQAKEAELEDTTQALSRQTSAISEFKLKYEQERQKTEQLTTALAETEKAVASLTTEHDALQLRLREAAGDQALVATELRAVHEALEKEKAQLQEREQSLLHNLEKAGERIVTLSREVQLQQEKAMKALEDVQALSTELDHERQLGERQNHELLAARDAQAVVIVDLRSEIARLSAQLDDKVRETEMVRQIERSLHESLRASMEEVGVLRRDVEKSQTELAELRSVVQLKEAALETSGAELGTVQGQLALLEQSNSMLQGQLAEAEAAKTKLTKEFADAEERAEGYEGYLADVIRKQRQQCDEMEERMSKKRKVGAHQDSFNPVFGASARTGNGAELIKDIQAMTY